MRILARISYIAAAAIAAGCATAGATYKSGVAPESFDRPPFYTGATVAPNARRVAHLPIRYQRSAENFDPNGGAGSPAGRLVAEMNAYLDSLALSSRLSPSSPEQGTAPDVHFGCNTDPIGDCAEAGETDGTNRRLELSVGRPSQDWIAWLDGTLGQTTDATLLITLELGQYWPRQKGLSIHKEVRLGTDYSVPIPWLTSLEQPVAVVQLTGALVGRDGRAIRIGAEGLSAKRSPLLLSAMGAQGLVTDEDLERVRTLRREDLAGQPLVWQVALQHLVTQLTGRAGTGMQ